MGQKDSKTEKKEDGWREQEGKGRAMGGAEIKTSDSTSVKGGCGDLGSSPSGALPPAFNGFASWSHLR